MSPSRLEVSEHAAERMKQRGITRAQVRRVIASGEILDAVDINGRRVKERKVGKRILVVVYLNIVGGQLVVTAYWKGVF